MKEKILSYVGATILIILVATLAVIVLQVAVERSEKVECLRLEKQSRMYEGFFYSQTEAEQCNIK